VARARASGWVIYVALWMLFSGAVYLAYRTDQPILSLLAGDTLEGKISSYDGIIHKYAQTFGVDWRLVASMISVESSFRHDAVSPAGAVGLMQIMPVVAREQNTVFSAHPEENIKTGIAHFASNLRRIKGRTQGDTLRLSLAAYNAGIGHLRDAQNLAIENGKSPRRWEDVAQMFALLEIPDYYEKAKYGYCQGDSVVEYVSRVFQKYNTYVALGSGKSIQLSQSGEDASEPRT
jgi:membrane-bound lytic murein transglycosylase F